jgi:hypothetical protein
MRKAVAAPLFAANKASFPVGGREAPAKVVCLAWRWCFSLSACELQYLVIRPAFPDCSSLAASFGRFDLAARAL